MGYKEVTLKLPTGYTDDQLKQEIRKTLGISDFSFTIDSKSLDARKKSSIHWLMKIAVASAAITGPDRHPPPALEISYRERASTILVMGSGPAGFFSAFVLQKAGFSVTLIERGADVARRSDRIRTFERTGQFDPMGNYAFGEGGAGTFSDGKLTARTKNISKEKRLVIEVYRAAGAPEEIRYMAHPHLGSNHLKKIVRHLRNDFINCGGTIFFETFLQDIKVQNRRVVSALTSAGEIRADYFILAPGHSAHETYRMLMRRGVLFRTKNFAIGCRVEHPQELINRAQWGHPRLPGVKAAEYRLTAKNPESLPVYTFCMCPGGVIVPATPYENTNIVNGMSQYLRNQKFANAACVAAVNINKLLGREATPLEAIEWLGALENRFYEYSSGYQAPFCRIRDFMDRTEPAEPVESSYPLGLTPAPLWELLPPAISAALREGLCVFSKKLNGFDTGIIMGLESKTSAPVQTVRDENRRCAGFKNLFIVGEGSGHSGGIISSACDGIRTAMQLVDNESQFERSR